MMKCPEISPLSCFSPILRNFCPSLGRAPALGALWRRWRCKFYMETLWIRELQSRAEQRRHRLDKQISSFKELSVLREKCCQNIPAHIKDRASAENNLKCVFLKWEWYHLGGKKWQLLLQDDWQPKMEQNDCAAFLKSGDEMTLLCGKRTLGY